MAIKPEFNNSALTFGPTSSTLLKFISTPSLLMTYSFIFLIVFVLSNSFFSNLIK